MKKTISSPFYAKKPFCYLVVLCCINVVNRCPSVTYTAKVRSCLGFDFHEVAIKKWEPVIKDGFNQNRDEFYLE